MSFKGKQSKNLRQQSNQRTRGNNKINKPTSDINQSQTESFPSPSNAKKSYASVTGHRNEPNSLENGFAQAQANEVVSRHMNDRLLYALSHCLGKRVALNTTDNKTFQGHFKGAVTDSDLSVLLEDAILSSKVDSGESSQSNFTGMLRGTGNEVYVPIDDSEPSNMIFFPNDIEFIQVYDVDFEPPPPPKSAKKNNFLTDTSISGNKKSGERELEEWVPDANIPYRTGLEGGDGRFRDENGNWDQFKANQVLFGIENTYDEHEYTTRIDRTAPDFEAKEKRAAELAQQILSKPTSDPHMAEERGQSVDSIDEDSKFSSVARGNDKYTPPSLRNQSQARAGEVAAKQIGDGKLGDDTVPSNSGTVPIDKNMIKNAIADLAKPVPQVKKKIMPGTPISQKKANAIAQLFSANSKSLSMATQRKLYGDKRTSKPIELEIMGTFRQFVSTEKERLQQSRQALHKKDKDGRIADLIEFHAKFKLNTPVPDDIKPLLGKERGDEKGSYEGTQPVVAKAEGASKDDKSVSPASKLSAAKLNVNATEFKPTFTKGSTSSPKPKEVNAFFTDGKPVLDGKNPVNWLFTTAETKDYNDPSTQAPTWPAENKPYRQQFQVTQVQPSPKGEMHPHHYPQQGFPHPGFRHGNQPPFNGSQGMNLPPHPNHPYGGHSSPLPPPPYISYPHPGGPMIYGPPPIHSPQFFSHPPPDNTHGPNAFSPTGPPPPMPQMPAGQGFPPGPNQGNVILHYPGPPPNHSNGPQSHQGPRPQSNDPNFHQFPPPPHHQGPPNPNFHPNQGPPPHPNNGNMPHHTSQAPLPPPGTTNAPGFNPNQPQAPHSGPHPGPHPGQHPNAPPHMQNMPPPHVPPHNFQPPPQFQGPPMHMGPPHPGHGPGSPHMHGMPPNQGPPPMGFPGHGMPPHYPMPHVMNPHGPMNPNGMMMHNNMGRGGNRNGRGKGNYRRGQSNGPPRSQA